VFAPARGVSANKGDEDRARAGEGTSSGVKFVEGGPSPLEKVGRAKFDEQAGARET